ncbi:MAG: DUF3822 family protein, partial [Chitinophagaceae bacterium]
MIEKLNIFNSNVIVEDACNLSIIFENDAVSFAVTNQQNELVKSKKWIQCSENEFIALVKKETEHDYQFSKINIAFHNALVTTLPNVDNIAEAESVLFLNGGKQHDHLMLDVLDNDTALAYQISYELLTNISYHFQGANYWHMHSVWMKTFKTPSANDAIFVHVEDHIFTLMIWKNQQAVFCTSYQYATQQEILFYILKVIDLYQMDQHKASVLISGMFADKALEQS